jgi:hypothetical protein
LQKWQVLGMKGGEMMMRLFRCVWTDNWLPVTKQRKIKSNFISITCSPALDSAHINSFLLVPHNHTSQTCANFIHNAQVRANYMA